MRVKGYNVKSESGVVRVQFQLGTKISIFCVCAEFHQKGADVYGKAVYAKWRSARKWKLGCDFDKDGEKSDFMKLSSDADQKGYGVCDIVARQ